jgi:hypothetical protein
MATELDFERVWQGKFSMCLDEVVGEEVRKEVMAGCEELSSQSPRQEVILWSKTAMDRLDSLVEEEMRREIMTRCACHYPEAGLLDIRERFRETKDLNLAHQMLQEKFESFLKDTLKLDGPMIKDVVSRGWGLAGIKEGNKIIATKIPKSGNLVAYMTETDPQVKRQHYCHCPRLRDMVKTSDTISSTYCYCSAGYYQNIWEVILEQPVEVEVLENVLSGDELCKFAIYLPEIEIL